MTNESSYILYLQDIDKTKSDVVGGKAANLGELTRINGIQVPPGFCITTTVFVKIMNETPTINALLDRLSVLQLEDRDNIYKLSAEIRNLIEGLIIPLEISDGIRRHLRRYDEDIAWAIRSSATAEDLPGASFAGQQDTYLNIIGENEILKHILSCWASLFTDRAVIYRMQNGFDHKKVHLSVVIQQMVFPHVSGIMFTADPVNANRRLLSIEASYGLGEALVSGKVNADIYKVNNGKLIDRKTGSKKLAIYPLKEGGNKEQQIGEALQKASALNDEQISQLERIGRKIESHFGAPQDIEWCLVNDSRQGYQFYIVQSRPITTLYPIPETGDQKNHVYVSVGHQQMMTDPMRPLGLSFYLMVTSAPMRIAGGRLFVDVAPMLSTTAGRKTIIDSLGKFDPLIKDALGTIVARGDFIELIPDKTSGRDEGEVNKTRSFPNYQALDEYDPTIVNELINVNQASLEKLKKDIQMKSGADLFDFIVDDIPELKKTISDPRSFGVIMTGMNASLWINEKMNEWLGEKNAADTLTQSVPNNITSEMGMALLNVADVIRPYPEIVEYLEHIKDKSFMDELRRFRGGQETGDAINSFLETYGMRCPGEIDITRARWSEKPAMLVPLILSNIKNQKMNASQQRFEQGRQEALTKEKNLIGKLAALPDGEQKITETKKMINLVRNYSGYREYPKYSMISRYFVYKQALLKEAEKLVQCGIIHEKEDVYYLSFEEFREVVCNQRVDYQAIRKRKEDYKFYDKLVPPRVMTSDGEIIAGNYKKDHFPAGAIAGLAVSSGIIEGRARVILNMEEADLEEGDILVTPFTDPSWTPVFVAIKGLVTEVGGLMTHGAVIAREYGLPAVVGVDNATRLIKDRKRIRLNGTEGYVEIL